VHKRGPGPAKRSLKRWIAARSEPEKAALISATAVLTAACLGVTGTIVANTLQARRSSATAASTGPGAAGPDRADSALPPDATAPPARGRQVLLDDDYSIDLDSPKPNLAMTDNGAAPGIDLTVSLGARALNLGPGAQAFRATDDAGLAFCEAATAPLPNIVSGDVTAGRSFCIDTGKGAWFWLKIVKIENYGYPGTISLSIDRLTHR
jgi:hypothetical protein